MSKKPKAKKAETAEAEDAGAKTGGSRKMLLMAVVMCLASLGGGFFLARMAYVEDAETFEPDYVAEDDGHGEEGDDGHGEKDDGHGKKDDGHGKGEKAELRTDIVDPLAKDGHDAEKALALQAERQEKDSKDSKGGHGDAEGHDAADSGLLPFGDFLTNIESFDSSGQPTTSFLKVNLMVAYRPDEGSGLLMEQRQPFMRDLFNSYLRGLSENDVRGMAGILYIKAELLKRARAAVGNDLPQEILINDLIVQ